MCFHYDQKPSFYKEEHRRARKQHSCCECDMPILPGEMHQHIYGVWGQKAQAYRTCSTCEWLRERVATSEVEHGCGLHEAYPPFGWLHEELQEGYDQSIGLTRLEVCDE